MLNRTFYMVDLTVFLYKIFFMSSGLQELHFFHFCVRKKQTMLEKAMF